MLEAGKESGNEGEEEMTDFMECKSCAEKPGSPILCKSCLHNRNVISGLCKRLDIVSKAIENGFKETDYRGTVYTQTFGQEFLEYLEAAIKD